MTDTTTEQPAGSVEGQEPPADEQGAKPDTEQAKPSSETEGADKGAADDGDEDLSLEDWKSIAKKLRASEASHRVKNKGLTEQLAEAKTLEEVQALVESAKTEAATEAKALVVENVALKFGLPEDLAAVLKGETREELEAHAKTLQKYAEKQPTEDPDVSGGLNPDDNDGSSEDVKAAVRKHLGKRWS